MSTLEPPEAGLGGLRVAIFEARMAGPMADLIRKHGGEVVEAPALREVPIGDNPEAIAFADRLIAGEFDLVLFLTGVGTRYANIPVGGLRIAVQEYGQPNPELIEGLETRGATVTRVPVYAWALPDDTGPLVHAIVEIAEGRIGAVVFTSAQQVVHLLQVAAREGREADLRTALAKSVIVASVGPTTTETLRANNLPVDIEPEHPKMGHLAVALANGWRKVVKG
jgi:uroporphyrinogen-III synthase